MTEDEAKKKWCPFAHQMAGIITADGTGGRATEYDATPVPVFNRAEGPGKLALWPAGARCIASECMAWRVTEYYRADTNRTTETGHCGLAGPARSEERRAGE